MGLHQNKNNFCSSKGYYQESKKTTPGLEKMFKNHIPDKGLVSRVYKELFQFKTEKRNKPILRWVMNMNGCFSKENTQMATWKCAQHHYLLGKHKSKP